MLEQGWCNQFLYSTFFSFNPSQQDLGHLLFRGHFQKMPSGYLAVLRKMQNIIKNVFQYIKKTFKKEAFFAFSQKIQLFLL